MRALTGLLLLLLIYTFTAQAKGGRYEARRIGKFKKDDVEGDDKRGLKDGDDEDVEGLDEQDKDLVEILKSKKRGNKGRWGEKKGDDLEDKIEKKLTGEEEDGDEEDPEVEEFIKELIRRNEKKEKGGEDNEDLEDGGAILKKRSLKKIPEACLQLVKRWDGKNHPDPADINDCVSKKKFFEGDVRLAEWQEVIIEALLAKNAKEEGRVHKLSKRGASKNLERWDFARDAAGNKILPYVIDDKMNNRARNAIAQAAAAFAKFTCIRLQPRTNEKAWIKYLSDGGCWSYVGRIVRTGEQEISIGGGCEYMSTVIHETLHALGFWHEQSRPDRDQYVEIKFENIKKGLEDNFEKYSHGAIDSMGSPYDTKSLMHYNAYAFSKNDEPTIVDRKTGEAVKTSRDFTDHDIYQLNQLYKCDNNATCTDIPTIVGNGGFEEERKQFYYEGEELTLLCADGHSPPSSGPTTSTCTTTGFTTSSFTCLKDIEGCADDMVENCPDWAGYGYCTEYKEYMSQVCKKSCNLCGDPGPGPGPGPGVEGCSQLPGVSGKGSIIAKDIKIFPIGEEVLVKCAEGYEVSGASTATCGANGFAPDTLVCKRATCNKLPTISGQGKFDKNKDSYEFGETVQLNCAAGYSVFGASSATCGSRGFNPSKLDCKRDCEAPIVIAIVSVSPSKPTFEHGDEIKYVCAGDMIPANDAVMRQTCNNGKFEPPANIKCVTPTCSKLPTISGQGKFDKNKDSYELGETVKLNCAAGYSVFGANSATCGSRGFTPSKLTCKRDTTNCIDNVRHCPYWESVGYCQGRYEPYMLKNCKKSCNQCDVCKDFSRNCERYERNGFCMRNSEAMQYICSKTCEFC